MSFVRTAADIAHKATITGLMASCVFIGGTIVKQVVDHRSDMAMTEEMNSGMEYQEHIKRKVEEGSKQELKDYMVPKNDD